MLEQMHDLSSKVAIVTGGSRGIGRAICLALAEAGADILLNYSRSDKEADKVKKEIEKLGRKCVTVRANVANFQQAQGLGKAVMSHFGRVDILVNNAGINRDRTLKRMTFEQWNEVIQTNLSSVFNCTKAVIAHFMSQRDGVIVNVSSVMGERGWVGESNYSASKGAVNAFTRCAAVELARFGVRVNAVLPGFTPTDLVAGLTEKDGGKGIKKQIPMRDFARVEDVAAAVIFLAGPDSAYITGSLLTVDGGASVPLGQGVPL